MIITSNMKTYIGTKIIMAEPMDEITFYKTIKNAPYEPNQETKEGYHVEYDNNYHSWSPKSVFEAAYREVSEKEKTFVTVP